MRFSKYSKTRYIFFMLVVGLFWLNLLRIHPEVFPPVFSVFWLDIVILFTVFLVLVLKSTVASITKNSMYFLLFSIGVAAVSLFPITDGTIDGKITYSMRIIYTFTMLPILFTVFFTSSSNVISLYATTLLTSAIPIGVIVFFQLFYVPQISDAVYWLWGTDKLRSLDHGSPRVYGSFYNANWFGVYSVILAVSVWYLREIKKIGRLLFFSSFSLALGFILVSGSRTSFFGGVVAASVLISTILVQKGVLSAIKMIFWILCGTSFLGIFLLRSTDVSLLRRWQELFSGQGVSSADGRFATWGDSWGRIIESPWLGSGVHGTPHNSFLATLEAFGIISGSILIGFYLLLITWGVILVKKRESLLVLPVILAFTVMAGTAEFFYTTQLVVIVVPLFMWIVITLFGTSTMRRD